MRHPKISALLLAAGLLCLPAAAQQVGSEPAQNGGYYPQSAPAPSGQFVPATLTLPAGTLLTVRTTELVSSDRNRAGDSFTTVLEQPLVAQGWVLARRGQIVQGRVANVQSAGRVRGVSQLDVALDELVLVDGQQVPIRTELVQSSAGTSRGRDVAGVGTTTGIGAIIGGAAGGGEGAAIGAAAGAVAGIAGVLSTRGRPTELYPETVLTFRLQDALTVDTQGSQQAFRAVTPQDYNGNGGTLRNPPRYRAAEGYPPPPYYYYPPYYYPYPGWYYGYYGYGFGPRFYVGPTVIIGRGFHHRR
ncbi:MAG TPA: hypothetical protein VE398_15505 [Acidobacteriota bacterium]|nr:hypothetical protein [Acidobacteriota bacterium]